MRSLKFISRTLFAVALVPALCHANINCTGAVTYLGTDANGVVWTMTGTAISGICSTVTQGNFQTSPTACKTFYSTLLADQLAGRTATVYYSDPALTQCSQIVGWTTQPTAYFVQSN